MVGAGHCLLIDNLYLCKELIKNQNNTEHCVLITSVLSKLWLLGREPKERAYYESLVPVFEQGYRIPYSLHQTYYKTILPEELQQNIEYMRSNNPGMEYRLWDDEAVEDFIRTNYGERVYTDYYLRITPIYGAGKADFFRYLLIYKLGGLYLDIKSRIHGNFAQLVEADVSGYLTYWDNAPGELHEGYGLEEFPHADEMLRGEYIQWMLWYAPGSPVLREVILEMLRRMDEYTPYTVGIGGPGVLATTGPWMYAPTVYKYKALDSRLCERNSCLDLGLLYSIYEQGDKQDLGLHKVTLKSDYRQSFRPFLTANNSLSARIHNVYAWVQSYYAELMKLKRRMLKP